MLHIYPGHRQSGIRTRRLEYTVSFIFTVLDSCRLMNILKRGAGKMERHHAGRRWREVQGQWECTELMPMLFAERTTMAVVPQKARTVPQKRAREAAGNAGRRDSEISCCAGVGRQATDKRLMRRASRNLHICASAVECGLCCRTASGGRARVRSGSTLNFMAPSSKTGSCILMTRCGGRMDSAPSISRGAARTLKMFVPSTVVSDACHLLREWSMVAVKVEAQH